MTEAAAAATLKKMFIDNNVFSIDNGGTKVTRRSTAQQHERLEMRLGFVNFVNGAFRILYNTQSKHLQECLAFDFPSTPFDVAGLGPRMCAHLTTRVQLAKPRLAGTHAVGATCSAVHPHL